MYERQTEAFRETEDAGDRGLSPRQGHRKFTNCLEKFHRQNPAPSSPEDWVDTSASEIRVFLCLRIAVGMNHKPEQRHYWSTDLFYRMPLFPKTMTQDRFDQLSRYLRVVDNEASHSPDDRLWKLRPVIEILQRQFSSVYTPPQDYGRRESLEISEAICSRDLQPRPARALRGEIKLVVRDGPSCGYICAFEVYSGKDQNIPASQRAVVNMMGAATCLGKGSSIPMTDVDSRSTSTGMLCLQWHGKRVVTMLSTVHGSNMVATQSHRGFKRVKPQVVVDYNVGMKGVQYERSCSSIGPDHSQVPQVV
nr:piggyBac transposable element-derived protein 4-like [Penaeus vannamei]